MCEHIEFLSTTANKQHEIGYGRPKIFIWKINSAALFGLELDCSVPPTADVRPLCEYYYYIFFSSLVCYCYSVSTVSMFQ